MLNPRMMRPAALAALFVMVLAPAGAAQEDGAVRTLGPYKVLHESPALKVLHQGRTGTCWSFATVSFLETEVARIKGEPVDLSEMYVVRQAILEKARRYMAFDGNAQFSQGGLSHDVTWLAKRYGMLPAAAYAGRPEDQRVHDHGELFRLLGAILESLTEARGRPSPRWEQAFIGVVDAYLGKPPETVQVGDRTLTPQEYASEELGLSVDAYVEVMSHGGDPFHEHAELKVPDNWMHYKKYINLPLDSFMAGMDHALSSGYSVAVDIDVSEGGFQAKQGLAKLPSALEKPGAVTQAVRDTMFDRGATTDDHLMHVTGIAVDDEGGRFYLTKNSWGEVGRFDGYLLISENYMRAKALAYMVHEDGLPSRR